jgi:galactosyl transferase GMA12/MNN10 family
MLTLYGGEQNCLKDASLVNKQQYCLRHGCALYVPEALLWTQEVRSTGRDHYAKILAMLAIFREARVRHKYLIWSDADIVIVDMARSPAEALRSILAVSVNGSDADGPPIRPYNMPSPGRPADPEGTDMVISWPSNTGCFFLRKSPTSLQMLERWWRYDIGGKFRTRIRELRWNDQGALIDMLWVDPQLRRRFAFYTYQEHALAAQFDRLHPDPWMIHTPGLNTKLKRGTLIKIEKDRRAKDGDTSPWPHTHNCAAEFIKEFLISGRTGEHA